MRTVKTPPAALGVVLLAACASSPTVQPELERQSAYRVWYTGPELRAELEHRWASRHPGDEWLVVRLALAGGAGGVTPVSRDDVTLRTPDGRTLALPDQATFRVARPGLSIALRSYDAWAPYSHRFDRSLRPCDEWFFSPPREFTDRDTIYPSNVAFCSGPLVFQVPGGVQPGEWELMIETEEVTARIPFPVEEPGR